MTTKKGFVILCFSIFITAIGGGIVIPIIPIYIKQVSSSGFIIGLVYSSLSLSMVICSPFVGRFSDKYGKKSSSPEDSP